VKRRVFVWLTALAVYAFVIGFVPILDKLALFPGRRPIDSRGATRKVVPFQSGELEMWGATSGAARARGGAESFVLRFYGNADRPEYWVAAEAEMFPQRAVEVWGVNYPGFGGSTGLARLARIGPAALSAFDELRRTAGERPIIVSGTSFGTIAALHVAARREVAGVVLHNPPALREMIIREYGWWNLWLLAGPLSRKVPAGTRQRRQRARSESVRSLHPVGEGRDRRAAFPAARGGCVRWRKAVDSAARCRASDAA
jgi:pimeloyl-ACP methyl ester carboxylesterase